MTYDPTAAFGGRGEWPVFYSCRLPWNQLRELLDIPGVVRAPGGIRCTWDVAPVLGGILGHKSPTPPLERNVQLAEDARRMPGLARYVQLGLQQRLREYQRLGALFLARRSWGMNCDPMRSGKSVQSLAASVLIKAERVLIVCPALAKFVWAEEVSKWLHHEALILEGRSGKVARQYCRTCDARGRVASDNGSLPYCDACKLKNGQANGYRLFQGEQEVDMALRAASYIIVNYDLLVAQKTANDVGVMAVREDLQGWAPILAKYNFDLCIADEAHLLRGWTTDQRKKGQTRRERFVEVVEHIPRVWGLTGTPIYGYTRDLWGQLDAISGGLFSNNSGLPFAFHKRYCEGHKDDYGWKANGRSPLAETELKERLGYFKLQRARAEILKDMPAKIRQVIRVQEDPATKIAAEKAARATGGTATRGGRLSRLLKQTSKIKRPVVVENVIDELAASNKVVVFTLLRDSAEKLGKAIEKACKSRSHSARMREVNTRVWLTHGDSTPQARFEMARAFREHVGAGAFVCTIDSVQVAVSLNGATSVHFADMHWQPSAMLQAEDRPYEVGTTGLSIVYYVVRGSIDEHVEAVVLPKIGTLAHVVDEAGADQMRDALAGQKETLSEVFARLSAHIPDEIEEVDDYD
jgi:SNF2 family DNA or RNA helicase